MGIESSYRLIGKQGTSAGLGRCTSKLEEILRIKPPSHMVFFAAKHVEIVNSLPL
jgi:hypothetical protein